MRFIVPALLIALAAGSLFIVDVSEYTLVLQFGKPVRVIDEPGLYFRVPFIQSIHRLTGRILLLDGWESEFLTTDKKNITVTTFALWRVIDPLKFYMSVYDRTGAESRLSDVISSKVGAEFGRTPFSDIVSVTEDSLSKDPLLELNGKILRACGSTCLKAFGVEIVDFGFSRFNFPDQNKDSVFNRMRAERGRIAAGYRSEGEEEAMKIRAKADRERSRILAEASRQARIIEGEARAEAARIRGQAYDKDPDFYLFTRTLESYERFLDERTTIVLPGDSPLLDLLNSGGRGLLDE